MSFIFSYIKDENDNRVGVLYAEGYANTFGVGFTKCNLTAKDKFDKGLGLAGAKDRAKKGNKGILPLCLQSTVDKKGKIQEGTFDRFINRAKRYFKDKRATVIFHPSDLYMKIYDLYNKENYNGSFLEFVKLKTRGNTKSRLCMEIRQLELYNNKD